MFAGTRGGKTRALILKQIADMPSNANQLAEALNMDYKTIRHHLDVLKKNGIIIKEGDKYGAIYFLSSQMEQNIDYFNDIWNKINKRR